jgi:hypothetical protein
VDNVASNLETVEGDPHCLPEPSWLTNGLLFESDERYNHGRVSPRQAPDAVRGLPFIATSYLYLTKQFYATLGGIIS